MATQATLTVARGGDKQDACVTQVSDGCLLQVIRVIPAIGSADDPHAGLQGWFRHQRMVSWTSTSSRMARGEGARRAGAHLLAQGIAVQDVRGREATSCIVHRLANVERHLGERARGAGVGRSCARARLWGATHTRSTMLPGGTPHVPSQAGDADEIIADGAHETSRVSAVAKHICGSGGQPAHGHQSVPGCARGGCCATPDGAASISLGVAQQPQCAQHAHSRPMPACEIAVLRRGVGRLASPAMCRRACRHAVERKREQR